MPSLDKKLAIRTLRAAVIALPVMLLLGLWLGKGQPVAPRVVGATINIVVTIWVVRLLRGAKNQKGS